ncbi:hypothetical protein TGDOM2_399670, partial [Toxoplasma gondii GAB2-2007-GAL-DOM2]
GFQSPAAWYRRAQTVDSFPKYASPATSSNKKCDNPGAIVRNGNRSSDENMQKAFFRSSRAQQLTRNTPKLTRVHEGPLFPARALKYKCLYNVNYYEVSTFVSCVVFAPCLTGLSRGRSCVASGAFTSSCLVNSVFAKSTARCQEDPHASCSKKNLWNN